MVSVVVIFSQSTEQGNKIIFCRHKHLGYISASQSKIKLYIISQGLELLLAFISIQNGNRSPVLSDDMRVFAEIVLKITSAVITPGGNVAITSFEHFIKDDQIIKSREG